MPPSMPLHAVFKTRPAQFEGPDLSDEKTCAGLASVILEALASDGESTISALKDALMQTGLDDTDPRLCQGLKTMGDQSGSISDSALQSAFKPDELQLVARALSGQLVVDNYQVFCQRMSNLFAYATENESGKVADYIPELSKADPAIFALGTCTIDGQVFQAGAREDDIETRFCAQSAMKPVNYAIAQELIGQSLVHDYVGREPSGHSFNKITLDKKGRPHNPMINAGAIMTTALINPAQTVEERFEFIRRIWTSGSAGHEPVLNQPVYDSERQHADRNFTLAYFMREHGCFPVETDMFEALDLYFRCCSLEMDIRGLSIMAGTLANGGVCPITERRVFQRETVKNVLSLMLSCGMYDYSGEFAFTVGLPAKSGVSGAMMLVVPGIAGFALYSPRLSEEGNPVRGVEFARQLVKTFPWHVYAPVVMEPDVSFIR